MFANKKPNNHFQYGNSGQMMHQNSFVPQGNQQSLIRNQPYPYPTQPQNFNWSGYQQPNPYYQQQPSYQPYPQNYQSGYVPQNMPYPNQPNTQKDSQFLFQNPLQPKDEMFHNQSYMPTNGYPMMNPYPKQNNIPKQPSGMQSLMNSFKSQDGSVDFNKMVNTAGQMMSAVNQVSSLVKGFGGFFKA